MGRMVAMSKPDFVGKRSLALADLEAPGRKQLVGLLPRGSRITAPTRARSSSPSAAAAAGHARARPRHFVLHEPDAGAVVLLWRCSTTGGRGWVRRSIRSACTAPTPPRWSSRCSTTRRGRVLTLERSPPFGSRRPRLAGQREGEGDAAALRDAAQPARRRRCRRARGEAFGVAPPTKPLGSAAAGERAALWLGPDEWLLLAEESAAGLMGDLEAALGGVFHSLVDISHRQVGDRGRGAGRGAAARRGLPARSRPRRVSRRHVDAHAAGEGGDRPVAARGGTFSAWRCCARSRPMWRGFWTRRRGIRGEAGARPRLRPGRRAEPSGVALVEETADGWRLLAVESSYARFRDRAAGLTPQAPARGELPDVPALLDACRRLGGRAPNLVAVDMPLALTPIVEAAGERSGNLPEVRGGQGGDAFAERNCGRAAGRQAARRFRTRRFRPLHGAGHCELQA